MLEIMRRRLLLGLLAAAALAIPAHASEEKKKPGKEELQAVDLAAVGLPIVAQGKIVNYIFAYVRLPVGNAAKLAEARAKEPYFRDALIRAAHRRPFTDPKDLNHVDEAALRSALLPEAQRIAGTGVITGVVVVSQQPQHRLSRPTGLGPAGATRAPVP